jgi:HD superfamily phosphodiesterase
VFGFEEDHARVWNLAAPYLTVRDNDGHTVYAYGIARALIDLHPDADPEVVLPGIILHDTGWSQVPPDEVLSGIAPGGNRPDLVIMHEKEGARIARDILAGVGHDAGRMDEIIEIIDGHDSRLTALSLNDALLKDADKLWRLTPHGVDTVMNWFGLNRQEALRLIASRVHDHLFTDAARTMAGVLSAIASIDVTPQRVALG